MCILANTIGEANGIEAITDKVDYDYFSILVRKTPVTTVNKIDLIRNVINLKVPANLKQVEIKKIIENRNKNGYIEKLRAFHLELNKYLNNLEQAPSAVEFINSVKYSFEELTADVMTWGPGAVSVGLGTWLAFNAQNPEILPQIKEATGAISFFGTTMTIASKWKNTKTTKYCRKYLADLSKLS